MPCRRTAARTARSGPAGSPGRSARTRDLRCRRAGTWRGRPRSARARSGCRWSERRGRAYGGGRGDSPPEAATTRAARVSRVDSSKRRYVTPMSRQDRLSADLDRGFRALEEGDVDEAQKVLERTERIDRHSADVVPLAAAIADAQLERAPILIDAYPTAHLIDEGLDPRMLGVFSGTPMTEGGASAPTVTNIRLFKTNLERTALDLDHLADEIRITVLHETAHYFGLDEADLERIGLD